MTHTFTRYVRGIAVKPCVVIPCFNHAATVAAVARAAQAYGPVLIVDDGSTVPLPELPGVTLLRLERNRGKGAALRAGFERAMELGFSHAITMDGDGQHFAEDPTRWWWACATFTRRAVRRAGAGRTGFPLFGFASRRACG